METYLEDLYYYKGFIHHQESQDCWSKGVCKSGIGFGAIGFYGIRHHFLQTNEGAPRSRSPDCRLDC